MKFDYKPKANQMGSPICRRTIHVTLGFAAFVCVVVALSFGKPNPEKNIAVAPLESTAKVDVAKTHKEPNLHKEPSAIDIAKTTAIPTIPPATTPSTIANLTKNEILPRMIEPIAPVTPTASIPEEEETQETIHNVKIHRGDTLSKVFTRLGISTKDIHEILTTDPASRKLASLQPGQTLKLRVANDQQIVGLALEVAPGNTLLVSRLQEGFQVEQKVQPLEKQLAFGKGKIKDSLISSAKRAGLDNKVVSQMVEIFGWNIDFALDLQPNDTFRVLYEEKCLDGERIETGNILAAEIVNEGTKYLAVRYTDKSGQTGYFSPDGYGMHQAFLRSPVNYTHISSPFGRRRHPIQHRMRQHKGVDYAAPHGTPVQATSHGKVIFAGTRGGYGKVIELQHGARYTTLYAHLSRFSKDLRVGREVKQGQVIGFVGQTGLATGAHLHYEFRIDGNHYDPQTVTLPKKSPINDKNKHHFLAHSKEMLRLLELHDHKIKMAFNENFK